MQWKCETIIALRDSCAAAAVASRLSRRTETSIVLPVLSGGSRSFGVCTMPLRNARPTIRLDRRRAPKPTDSSVATKRKRETEDKYERSPIAIAFSQGLAIGSDETRLVPTNRWRNRHERNRSISIFDERNSDGRRASFSVF